MPLFSSQVTLARSPCFKALPLIGAHALNMNIPAPLEPRQSTGARGSVLRRQNDSHVVDVSALRLNAHDLPAARRSE
jgi:hypothetical protein